MAVSSRHTTRPCSRECISEYPLGVTNYNFGGSCEATAVDALVHANTRSIPFPFPDSSLIPLYHPTPSNLPSLFWFSLSLPPSRFLSLPPAPSLFLVPSLSPPHVISFSHTRTPLFIALSPTGPDLSPSRRRLSFSRHPRSLACSLSPRPFCGESSRAGHRWGAGSLFDRSIEPRFDQFSLVKTSKHARATFFFFRARE